MDKKNKILIVEDDETTQYLCEFTLHKEGFQVTVATSIAEAKASLLHTNFNLVLLDLNLPDGKGMELIQHFNSQPFLIMTVHDTPQERYHGLEAGAGDYMLKPFHPGELIHRINNMLAKTPHQSTNNIQFGEWVLNLSDHTLKQGSNNIELTRGEFSLLAELASAKGRVLSREFLLDSIAREPGEGHPRTVDVLIFRLRKKIESDPKHPHYILTAPGFGYRLDDVL